MTPEQALAELKEGNKRFVENRMLHPRTDLERIRTTFAEGQNPLAIILTCSDSRVPAEIIFDQGIGHLFVVRVAGNVANGDEIGSIEYAVEYLHSPLCVVMGHTGCGAVTAAIAGGRLALNIDQLVRQIKTAVAKTRREKPYLFGEDLVNAAVRTNVFESIEELLRSSIVREHSRRNKLTIAGTIYQMDRGEVTWLGMPDQDHLL